MLKVTIENNTDKCRLPALKVMELTLLMMIYFPSIIKVAKNVEKLWIILRVQSPLGLEPSIL